MSDDFRDENGRFTKGNPGKPKGARNRLATAFLETLAADFEEHGIQAIEELRASNPGAYANVIGKLMPKLMELSGPDGGPIEQEHRHIPWDFSEQPEDTETTPET